MEMRHLRYFVALADCLSFTRAAERVHVTQSTLSHQIRQLEEELGQPLFERIGKKVVTTEAGELLRGFASRALREVDQGVALLKPDAGNLTGQVRIGATHTFNMGLIPECVALFLARHPTVRISVEELSAEVICSRLRAGELDLGIAYRPEDPTDLWFEPLYNEEMVLVVSDTHPLAGRKRIRMVELHRQDLVLLGKSFSTRTMIDECFSACGAEPMVVAEMSTVAPMLGLVARTQIGAIVAINAVPEGMSGLTVIPLESPTPTRTPGILWRLGETKPVFIQSFAVILRKTALGNSLRREKVGVRVNEKRAGRRVGERAR
ncbi:transcriptional regulator, LysR family [Variovorax sp. HW608]|uniref:LysR substrate-binding domain-containing protein n=1 Tax=Variovorax sp. HW608 TaxID=1034889 RepID=UPI00081FDA2D|nr:LysR substrate-binding domain-containing protein [Variovorax sp. HW608]SCK42413.1 transcriptional regulator, LysR family [Variovorax sp. HW608]